MKNRFVEVKMTDHEFADWCREHGWRGAYRKVRSCNIFITPTGSNIAIVRYRNSPPIDRWIFLNTKYLKNMNKVLTKDDIIGGSNES